MSHLPLFPLGTVLLPNEVLPLHVFEPRYRTLMADLGGGAGGEFGVVLITRGSEVGGGDVRAAVGTVARILEASELPDGRWVIAVVGTRRFRVDSWLPDDPYPRAEVIEADDLGGWNDAALPLLAEAERCVRRFLAMATEAGEAGMSVTFELAAEPDLASWQLAALLPAGPLDRQHLLEVAEPRERLRRTAALADEASQLLALRLGRAE